MLSHENNRKYDLLCFILLIVTVFAFGCGKSDQTEEVSVEKGLWTCGMHPQVLQDEPGNCPICGMKLTPVKTPPGSEGGSEEHAGEQLTEAQDRADKSANGKKKILYWRAPMDPTYVSDKPGKSPMGMDLIPVYEGEEASGGSDISIDPAVVQNMGIRTAEVERKSFYRIIRTVGHVDYNEQALYTMTLKFDGWIEKLFVNRTGDHVRQGEPLFSIYSPELVATQSEYLLAYENDLKLRQSDFEDVSAGAASLLEAARQRLRYWDISDTEIKRLEQSGKAQRTLTIYSPADGIVVHKNAIEGDFFKAGANLFRIADLSKVWVYAHIFEYELPWIRLGQNVQMELPYVPGRTFHGNVDYIYPYLDSKTRDVKIRLVFNNPTLELKPQMYANITIESRSGDKELVIPSEAIIRSGKRNLVFIDSGQGRFRPQEIRIGPEGEEGLVQVLVGLQEGQRVVTSAQFLLDSESRLREAIQKMIDRKAAPGEAHQH